MAKGVIRRVLEETPRVPRVVLGGVYKVRDHTVGFPGTTGARTTHQYRWVVVVQSRPLCHDQKLKTVQIVPCSTSARGPSRYSLALQAQSGGLPKASVALVEIAQPIAKTDLLEHCGTLEGRDLSALLQKVANVFGLRGPEPAATIAAMPAPTPPGAKRG